MVFPEEITREWAFLDELVDGATRLGSRIYQEMRDAVGFFGSVVAEHPEQNPKVLCSTFEPEPINTPASFVEFMRELRRLIEAGWRIFIRNVQFDTKFDLKEWLEDLLLQPVAA